MLKNILFITLLNFSTIALANSEHKLLRKCFKIEGMMCGSCKEKITNKVKSLEVVKEINISLKDEKGEILLEADTPSDKIVHLIQDAGYSAKETVCD